MTGIPYAVSDVSTSQKHQHQSVGLTEAVKDVEEDDGNARDAVDRISPFTHPERSRRNILPARQHVWQDGKKITQTGQDNEGSDQVVERRLRAESDGTKRRAEYSAEDCRLHRAGQSLVNTTESAGEWDSIVATECPPDATDGKKCSDNTDHDRKEDDEQQTEGAGFVSGRLRVYCRERK